MTIRRLRPQGVEPLEVWDALVNVDVDRDVDLDLDLDLDVDVDESSGVGSATRALWPLPASALPDALGDLVVRLQRGTARRANGGALPQLPIEAVVVGGGGATAAAARAIAARARVPTTLRADPCAALDGARVLHGARARAVVDVGQTAAKVRHRGVDVVVPRDLARVPIAADVGDADAFLRARDAVIAWLAALWPRDGDDGDDGDGDGDDDDVVVCALPCEIDNDGALRACSLPWHDRDNGVLPAVLAAAGHRRGDVVLLNDAELAAVAVAAEPATPPRTLVLTVGFGVGAAFLVDPGAAAARRS